MDKATRLINDLDKAFNHTMDNNRDIIADPTFPMSDVMEEVAAQAAYQFLQAYIIRNTDMVNSNLENH